MTCRHYEEWTGGCDEMEHGIDHTWCEPCPYTNENEMKSCENYETKKKQNANTVKVVDLLQSVKTQKDLKSVLIVMGQDLSTGKVVKL